MARLALDLADRSAIRNTWRSALSRELRRYLMVGKYLPHIAFHRKIWKIATNKALILCSYGFGSPLNRPTVAPCLIHCSSKVMYLMVSSRKVKAN